MPVLNIGFYPNASYTKYYKYVIVILDPIFIQVSEVAFCSKISIFYFIQAAWRIWRKIFKILSKDGLSSNSNSVETRAHG